MSVEFYARDPAAKKAWKFTASERWYVDHDNGCAVSIGFTVGEDITERQLKALHAVEVDYAEGEHSGCQSACVRRGDARCRW